jgi:hypothetical protein
MLKFLRTQEHIERGHENFALVKAMFSVLRKSSDLTLFISNSYLYQEALDETLEDDSGSVFSAATFVSPSSTSSAASATRLRRRQSLGSSCHTTRSTLDGLKGSVSRRTGDTYSTIYFRINRVGLTASQSRAFQRELRLTWLGMHPTGDRAPELPQLMLAATAFKFCNIRHPPAPNRLGVMTTRTTILRSPRDEIFYTAIKTDVDGSYAYVLAILSFCDNTFVFVRWLTDRFPGSSGSSSSCNRGVFSRFQKLQVTSAYAIIDVVQVSRVVCVVPVFGEDDKVWLNTFALGTALKSYSIVSTDGNNDA